MTSNSRSRPATRSGVPTIMRWARVGKYSSRVRPFSSNRPEPGTMRTRATASLRRPVPLDVDEGVATATGYSFSACLRARLDTRLVLVGSDSAAADFVDLDVVAVDALAGDLALLFAGLLAVERVRVPPDLAPDFLAAGRAASARPFGTAFGLAGFAGSRFGLGSAGAGRPFHAGTAPSASASGF